jgi:hypothetical protein
MKLDEKVSEKYIQHIKTNPLDIDEEILSHFGNNQSKEFYEGMMAGVLAYYMIIDGAIDDGRFKDGLTHISLDLQKVIVRNL